MGFVDAAAALLAEGQQAFKELGLSEKSIIQSGDDAFLFLWRGTVATEMFRLALAREKISQRRKRAVHRFAARSAPSGPDAALAPR